MTISLVQKNVKQGVNTDNAVSIPPPIASYKESKFFLKKILLKYDRDIAISFNLLIINYQYSNAQKFQLH